MFSIYNQEKVHDVPELSYLLTYHKFQSFIKYVVHTLWQIDGVDEKKMRKIYKNINHESSMHCTQRGVSLLVNVSTARTDKRCLNPSFYIVMLCYTEMCDLPFPFREMREWLRCNIRRHICHFQRFLRKQDCCLSHI